MDSFRPYPAPRTPFVMHQTWQELLFMHWAVPHEVLRTHVPAPLPLDTYEGAAFIGVVPFMMRDVRPRYLPAVPRLSDFPELNVRTYTTLDGRPGVYFFSLDAANPIAVELARATFNLPYRRAVMEAHSENDGVHYASTRTDRRAPPAYFRAVYRPAGPAFIPVPGSLEYFLTARYCLYTVRPGGDVWRGEIDHAPWPLQAAACAVETNTMTKQIDLTLSGAPLLHYAESLEVRVWMPVPRAAGSSFVL